MINEAVTFMVEDSPAPGQAGPSNPPSTSTEPGRPVTHWKEKLTPAEARVLHHLLSGNSNKEIAEAIGRSEATIKNQVASIFRKAGIHSRSKIITHFNPPNPIP